MYFITGIHGWFDKISINVIYHIITLKKKSISSSLKIKKKSLDKIQHPFMITYRKTKNGKKNSKSFILKQGIFKKLSANIRVKSKRLIPFPLTQKQSQCHNL